MHPFVVPTGDVDTNLILGSKGNIFNVIVVGLPRMSANKVQASSRNIENVHDLAQANL